VPRETTLANLAAEIEVSHQALSERLRRGHGTLVERSLRPGPTAPFQS
jgi:predicted DNA binding protein